MATFSSITRQHVLQAIEEYDSREADDFLALYGFAPQDAWTIRHEGRVYDLPAVVGVAHRFATGRIATPDDLAGSLPVAAAILRKRGFEVEQPGGASVAAPAVRATRTQRVQRPAAPAKPRRASEPERVAPVCPTCFTTLAATGRCDYCD